MTASQERRSRRCSIHKGFDGATYRLADEEGNYVKVGDTVTSLNGVDKCQIERIHAPRGRIDVVHHLLIETPDHAVGNRDVLDHPLH